MEVSAVILTWNSERYINRCLSTLLAELGKHFAVEKYEVLIVDNGSKDKTGGIIRSMAGEWPGTIKPIFLQRNVGTTYSRNLALMKAKGEVILLIDSDVEVSTGSIKRLIEIARSNLRAGIVAPRLVYPDGRLQKSTDSFPTLLSKSRRYFLLRRIEEKEQEEVGSLDVREVEYAISAMWVLRREVIDKVGLFDEHFFYAPEDVDYCIRVWRAGYFVLSDEGTSCVHHGQEASRGLRINKLSIKHFFGLMYLFRKYGCFLRKPKI